MFCLMDIPEGIFQSGMLAASTLRNNRLSKGSIRKENGVKGRLQPFNAETKRDSFAYNTTRSHSEHYMYS